jgi:hypothetical protein
VFTKEYINYCERTTKKNVKQKRKILHLVMLSSIMVFYALQQNLVQFVGRPQTQNVMKSLMSGSLTVVEIWLIFTILQK